MSLYKDEKLTKYMEQLKIRQMNDELVQKEIDIMRETGQSYLTNEDQRSPFDRYVSIIEMKSKLNNIINKITNNSTETNNIISKLSDDNVEFVYKNQNNIVKQIQETYGEQIDTDLFMDFLNTYQKELITTKGLSKDLDIISKAQLLKIDNGLVDNIKDLIYQSNAMTNDPTYKETARIINRALTMFQDNSLTDDEIRKISELSSTKQLQISNKINDVANILPNNDNLQKKYELMKKYINEENLAPLYSLYLQWIDTLADNRIVDMFDTIYNNIGQEIPNLYQAERPQTQTTFGSTQTERMRTATIPMMKKYLVNFIGTTNDPALTQLITNGRFKTAREILADGIDQGDIDGYRLAIMYLQQVPDLVDNFNNNANYYHYIDGSPKGRIDGGAIGYMQLGKYFINNKLLNGKNRLSLTTQKRKPVQNFKSLMIGDNVKRIISKIGNEVEVRDEDFKGLSENEKQLLNNIFTKTGINISLPTIFKTQLEKDIGRYNVISGELRSGNDNVNLVRELKRLLIKLSNQDVIPRSEARDLLLDIAALEI